MLKGSEFTDADLTQSKFFLISWGISWALKFSLLLMRVTYEHWSSLVWSFIWCFYCSFIVITFALKHIKLEFLSLLLLGEDLSVAVHFFLQKWLKILRMFAEPYRWRLLSGNQWLFREHLIGEYWSIICCFNFITIVILKQNIFIFVDRFNGNKLWR